MIEVLDQAVSLADDRPRRRLRRRWRGGRRRLGAHRKRAASNRRWLSRVRVALGVLGVTLLLLGGSMRSLQLSPILVDTAFLALLVATLVGGIEGWQTRGSRDSQLPTAKRPTCGVRVPGRRESA